MLADQPVPIRRVVLLGASNLIRGIRTVVTTAGQFWDGPLDILAALGHGRSYGVESRVFARTLPGIRRCGLWSAWGQCESLPTAALVTDIGNDLLYDLPVVRIAAWVEECLSQLAERCDRIIVTELPVDSVLRMSRAQFYALRTLIFPMSRSSYERVRDAAQELNEQIVALAARYHAHCVKPRATWYGWDPIHIRSRCFTDAWREILSAWSASELNEAASWSLREWLALRLIRPEQRRLFGVVQRRSQPALILANGTRISLY